MSDKVLVPISVEALVVGEGAKAADKAPAFDALGALPPVPASIVNQPFTSKPVSPGVHLHWRLPAALSHGQQNASGEIVYPKVPTRWIIQRLLPAGQSIERKIWLVESDFYTTELHSDSKMAERQIIDTTTIPCLKSEEGRWVAADGENLFAYLGAKREWDAPPLQGGAHYDGLTCIGAGDPSFAAFYPKCRSVFGFHDWMDKAPAGTYTYVVAGYYEKEGNDPLHEGQPMADMGWSLAGGPAAKGDGTLCHGTVHGVQWAGAAKAYESGVPKVSGSVQATIGSTSAEALANLVMQKLAPGDEGLERILTCLQYNLLGDLDATHNSDAGIEMEERVHRQQFSVADGGTSWVIRAESGEKPHKEPPPRCYQALLQLNALQRRVDSLEDTLQSQKKELYDAWYKYIIDAYDDDPFGAPDTNDAAPGRNSYYMLERARIKKHAATADANDNALHDAVLAAIRDTEKTYTLLYGEPETPAAPGKPKKPRKPGLRENAGQAADSIRETLLNTGYLLESTEGERFYRANPPMLLFSGAAMRGNGWDDDAPLPCRRKTLGRLRVAFSGGSCVVTEDALIKCWAKPVTKLPPQVENLAAEAVLASPDFVPVLTACAAQALKQPASEPLRAAVEKAQASGQCFENPLPDSRSLLAWRQPWSPLLLDWSLQIQPARTDEKTDNSLDSYTLGDIDFYRKAGAAGKASPLHLSGSTLLSPHAVHGMGEMLSALVKDCGDLLSETVRKKLAQAIDAVKGLPVLSQRLDGLNEALIMQQSLANLPILDPDGLSGSLAASVSKWTGAQYYAPMLDDSVGRFFPVRAGFLDKYKVRIIDSFGQFADVDVPQSNMHVAESMREPYGGEGRAALPPRLMVPCRTSLAWVSHSNDAQPSGQCGENSPVLGFVMPNLIGGSLQIYSAEGDFYGFVQASGNGAKWMSAPHTSHTPAGFASAHLRAFVNRLLGGGNRALADLLAHIDHSYNTICAQKAGREQFLSLCFGNLLALVRASVAVEQKGLPAHVQGWARSGLNANYTKVPLGLRFGDSRKVDDGFVGMFVGDSLEDTYRTMHIYAEHSAASQYLVPGSTLLCALEDEPRAVTFLADPMAVITCRTGFLPATAMELPALFYEKQIENMDALFRAAPVLSPGEGLSIPLPGGWRDIWSYVYSVGDESHERTCETPQDMLQPERQQAWEVFLKAGKRESE